MEHREPEPSGTMDPTASFSFPPRPSTPAQHKRSRIDDDDGGDDDDDDGFDPVFDATDATYIDPSIASRHTDDASSSASPSKPRPRSVSNTSNGGDSKERKPIQIEYIQDKGRRNITFSKRKAGIMKKAYELSTLTGTQVLLLVVSETGLVYTFTTPKLSAIVNEDHGQRLIEACLAADEGQLPAFAQRDYGLGEPTLTIKRSNGDKSPRRRQPSGGMPRPPTPSSEGRRTSSRHSSSSYATSTAPTHAPVPMPPAMSPSPRRSSSRSPLEPHSPHPPMAHAVPSLHHPPPPMQPVTTAEQLNALYEQMAASSAAHSASLSAMSIPPYYTDGGYQHPRPEHEQWHTR